MFDCLAWMCQNVDIVLAAFLGAVLIILVFKPESKKEGHEKSADGMKKMLDLSARKHGRTAWWACVQYDLLNNGKNDLCNLAIPSATSIYAVMLIPPGKRYIFEGEYPDMKKFGLCITTITFYNELGDFLESGDGEPVYIDNYGQMGTFRDCNSGPQTAPNGDTCYKRIDNLVMPPPGQENKQGIWVVLRLYRDRLDNTNNWERFYEEAGGMIKVFECNEPSSSTGSKGKRQKMRKTNTKKFTKGRELKLATVAEVRSNSAGMAGVFGEALPKLTPQTAPWDHNTPFLKAKSVASLFPHPSSAYMALSVSKPYNGIKVEGIYPDKDAFSSLLYMDFLACNLSNTATTGGHPHFDTRLFKKDEKEKSICVADSGDRKQTTEADEMAPLSGAYGFPFAHGKPYQFIVTDSDADLGDMSRADIPGVPAVHMKWTPDTPPEGRVVVFRFISYKKEGLHAAMGGGTLQNYLDLHQNDTNSAECARSLGNGKFYPKVQYFTVPRKTNFLQRVRNTVCAFSVSASMAYHKARFILQCLLARD